MNSANNYCIILAGGIGKRLWPRSCREKPKQFIDFFHCGSTLLQQTYRRVSRIVPRENIYVSTFADYHDLVVEQLPDLAEANILAEPVQLSTAPATAWASFHIAMLNPEANIFVSPCDQFIDDEAAFESEVLEGLEYTHEHDTFLALGVPANEANSAYGYIQMGPRGGAQPVPRALLLREARPDLRQGVCRQRGVLVEHGPLPLERAHH